MKRYSLLPVKNAHIKVGILGGSFNPAHQGHRCISLEIIKRLKLDYVVWLVSPQNPLKKLPVRHALNSRVEQAIKLKASNKILVSDIEKHFKNAYSATNIRRIKKMHPRTHFTWIMGADNMVQVHKWYQWKQIFKEVFVIVIDRSKDAFKALKSRAANNFTSHKVIIYGNNVVLKNNNWCLIRTKKIGISSTEIRSKLKYS